MARINLQQFNFLMARIKSVRIAKRKLGNKQFSYLESWDVRAHLIRIFGFGNFDAEVLDSNLIGVYDYVTKRDGNEVPMVEVMWQVTFALTIRDENGDQLCRYVETAVGSATKGRDGAGLGDIHDNAVKSATSDALKRCAINMGTQFGLSLYNSGQESDVVTNTLIKPEGVEEVQRSPEEQAAIDARIAVRPTDEPTNEGGVTEDQSPENAASPAQDSAAGGAY